jgi:hypothetical protein
MAVCDFIHAEVARVEAELQKLLAVRNAMRRAASLLDSVPDNVADLLPPVPSLPTAAEWLAAAGSCPWIAALLPPGFGPNSVLPLAQLRKLQAGFRAQIAGALRGPIGRGVRLLQVGAAALAPVRVLLGQLQQLEQCLSGVCNQVGSYAQWVDEFEVDSLGHPLIAASAQAQAKASAAKAAIDAKVALINSWA